MADDTEPEKEDTAEDALETLNSSYGDRTSFTKPYRIVEGVDFMNAWYDRRRGDVQAKFGIRMDVQAPGGDSWIHTREFTLSRKDVEWLAVRSPESFKDEIYDMLIKLHNAYSDEMKRQKETVLAVTGYIGTGLPAGTGAPDRATFRKTKPPSP